MTENNNKEFTEGNILWKNVATASSFNKKEQQVFNINKNEILIAKVGDKLKLNGMFSLGKWVYEGNITGRRFDVNNNNISGGTTTTYFVDGTRVGDVAQMTASIGAAYELAPRFNVDANYIY